MEEINYLDTCKKAERMLVERIFGIYEDYRETLVLEEWQLEELHKLIDSLKDLKTLIQ